MKLGATFSPKNELHEEICNSLSTYLKLPESEIILTSNEDKYHEKDDPALMTQPLEEIFGLMRELNEIGLQDDTIGATEDSEKGFVDALRHALTDIYNLNGADPLQYTELGPEPIKTKFILDQLTSWGTRIARYSGVDINPASRSTMENTVSELVPPECIHYHTVLFEKLAQEENYRLPGTRNLVTMLGFEEGNDHPHEIHEMLDSILEPGDLLLTEMQTLPQTDWAHIFNFYHTDSMRRFSKVIFRRTFPNLCSEYGVFLVPVSLAGFDSLMVAVTAERIIDERALQGKLFVTNYCVKYTLEDYKKIRESTGKFRVLSQHATGDGAIVFQVTQKV